MKKVNIEGYVEFDANILKDWIDNGVNYVKIVNLNLSGSIEAFELIPNSEIPETGDLIHHILSEDIEDLLETMEKVKFLVHEIYLEEEEETE
ncbi:hypothetical protein QG516_24080 [Pedobacter gandavensis]|uniref:hypothetical protein n=1 Tax=Pedobacter TaxID=84567 RepID=UPI000705C3F1|nr:MULTISPECIES: hypothetical protein [Pedobacter]ALL07173.1 hypothetical protein AQ505_17775 [Pedobacter sp. PACM 27299]WGQ09596.1 hypothetical protein QG516_24080 [Pedobacter gandavensis]